MSNIEKSAGKAGTAAQAAEEAKVVSYAHLSDHYVFHPLGFETMGTWGPAAKRLIGMVGARLQAKNGEMRSLEFLKQQISLEIQRGNAASVIVTAPPQKNLNELYFMAPKHYLFVLYHLAQYACELKKQYN